MTEPLKIVLAHGVFDVLHLGHLRYLQAAAKLGDILWVSITADEFVAKGPGRPVFSGPQRAEMVEAIDCVDHVIINDAETAVPIIEMIKPAVYVKGADYVEDDARLVLERAAVERHGGRVEIINEVQFSSSSLINQFFVERDPRVAEYLDTARRKGMLKRCLDALDKISKMRVLMVGEAILDEYIYCDPLGMAGKEKILAVKLTGAREEFAGGVFAAAETLSDFVKEVDIVALTGEGFYPDKVFWRGNVSMRSIGRPAPCVRKTRYVDPHHMTKLFEVYHFDDTPIRGDVERDVMLAIEEDGAGRDLVIVNDYGHGMITGQVMDIVISTGNLIALNAQTNGANRGFNLITRHACGADIIVVDELEARLAVRDKRLDIVAVAQELQKLMGHVWMRPPHSTHVIVTAGADGCVTPSGLRVPAFTNRVVDTMGAGDAFLAVAAPLIAAGVDEDVVCLIGNAVGALKVSIPGHRKPVERAALVGYLKALLK